MECKEVRDRFSSLLEDELDPAEEKIMRDHLTSCSECQKDLQQFTQTIRWLHSLEQVEVPDGFLGEICKGIEERKSKDHLIEENRWQWLRHAVPLKLPVQALAMVTIVFLAFYLTKMAPFETSRPKDTEYKKPDVFARLPVEKQATRPSLKPSPVNPPINPIEKAETSVAETTSVPAEAQKEGARSSSKPSFVKPIEKNETSAVKTAPVPTETQKREVALAKESQVSLEASHPLKGVEKDQAPVSEPPSVSLEAGKTKALSAKGAQASLAARPPQEILLRSSDLEKTLSRLDELLRQFGGKIVTKEENIFLASVPAVTFSEFEKELSGLGVSEKKGEMAFKRRGMERLDVPGGTKPAAPARRREIPTVPEAERKDHILVRIHLLQE
jgi:hypothetical protein